MSEEDVSLEAFERVQEKVLASLVKQLCYSQKDLPEFQYWDGENCFNCDEPLPKERVKLGRVHCIECQTTIELRDKFS